MFQAEPAKECSFLCTHQSNMSYTRVTNRAKLEARGAHYAAKPSGEVEREIRNGVFSVCNNYLSEHERQYHQRFDLFEPVCRPWALSLCVVPLLDYIR